MESSLYLCFKKQAKKSPLSPCLIDLNHQFNYQQALDKVESIATNLHHLGIKDSDVVALFNKKTTIAPLVFLALSKIGADILTLDLAFPAPMIEFTLKDANCTYLLLDTPIKGIDKKIQCFSFDEVQKSKSPFVMSKTKESAWLVYSSGSTGKPKGIKISSKAILSSTYSRYAFSAPSNNESVACNIYFYWEVFRPLFLGASVHVIDDKSILNIDYYLTYLSEKKITETLWTPSFAEMLCKCFNPQLLESLSLKRVWLNGEVVSKEIFINLEKTFTNVDFYNLYSISETFDVSAQKLSKENLTDSAFTQIGKPLKHISFKILDKQGNFCPIDKQGELYISGDSLCEGYLNREDLNERSFIYEVERQGLVKYFKTGDVAYRDKKNDVYILGRMDSVVKLRGYNVSLLAIESTLKQQLEINQCAIKLGDDKKHIEAFIEPRDKAKFIKDFSFNETLGISNSLTHFLGQYLPHYSLPSTFYLMDKLSINPYSAKLQRKGLIEKVNPHNLNDKLLNIWQKVLGIESDVIHKESDFFALGANSLQSIEFVHLFKESFNQPFNLDLLETHSDFASQLSLIETDKNETKDININFLKNIKEYNFNTNAKPALPLNKIKKWLITGATGFLGAHFLHQQLQINQDGIYYCLIRAADKKSARNKLINTFIKYHLNPKILAHRIVYICGDIEKEKLGLDIETWHMLRQNIDGIFHAAAKVNLVYPLEKIEKSITFATKSLLDIATQVKLKPFIYISSDAVFNNENVCYPEKFIGKNHAINLNSGYAKAKWLAENLIRQAFKQTKLPFAIFRLGNLSASLKTKANPENDSNTFLIQSIIKTQSISKNLTLEFTPVDRVCDFINQHIQLNSTQPIYNLSLFNTLYSEDIKAVFNNIEDVADEKLIQNLNRIKDLFTANLVESKSFAEKKYHLEKVWPEIMQTHTLKLSMDELKLALVTYSQNIDEKYYEPVEK